MNAEPYLTASLIEISTCRNCRRSIERLCRLVDGELRYIDTWIHMESRAAECSHRAAP